MSRVAELDRMLEESGFFWLQHAEFYQIDAIVLACALPPEDWHALDAIWRLRPTEWQRCLAVVLAAACPPPAVPWLLEMIELGPDAVALQAIDELRELQRARAMHLPWPAPVVDRVRSLWRQHRGFSPSQLEQFLDDMSHGR